MSIAGPTRGERPDLADLVSSHEKETKISNAELFHSLQDQIHEFYQNPDSRNMRLVEMQRSWENYTNSTTVPDKVEEIAGLMLEIYVAKGHHNELKTDFLSAVEVREEVFDNVIREVIKEGVNKINEEGGAGDGTQILFGLVALARFYDPSMLDGIDLEEIKELNRSTIIEEQKDDTKKRLAVEFASIYRLAGFGSVEEFIDGGLEKYALESHKNVLMSGDVDDELNEVSQLKMLFNDKSKNIGLSDKLKNKLPSILSDNMSGHSDELFCIVASQIALADSFRFTDNGIVFEVADSESYDDSVKPRPERPQI